MPPVKPRDMEDTWNPAELEKSLKGSKDDRKKSRDKDRDRDRDKDRERRKERPKDDEERKHRRRKEEDGDRKDRDKEKRDRDKDRERDKDKDKEKKDRERRHRDKENGESEERRHRRKEGDEKDEDRERRRRKHKEEGDADKTERRRQRIEDVDKDKDKEKRRRHRGDEDKEKDKEKRRRHHDGEDDEERRKRREDRKKTDDDGREKRHKDEDREHRRKRPDETDEERRQRHRREDENGEKRRHRDDKDKDPDRERRREERERRHRDEDGKSSRHRDKEKEKEEKKKEEEEKSTKKSSKGKGKVKDARKAATKTEDADEYNYDDDDFEDYEEDFEDDDDDDDEDDKVEISEKEKVKNTGKESPPMTTPRSVRDVTSGYIRSKNWEDSNQSRREMDDILQAMDAENNRLLKESQNNAADDDDDNKESYEKSRHKGSKQRPTTAKRSFINFVSAKQRVVSSKASLRAKTRGRELLQIIELDRAAYDLFDMPPVSEYELYMRTYGRSDTKQKNIQTNEDNIDKDIQTEEIETVEKWIQCPPEDTKGWGGDKETEEEEAIMKPVDTVALTKFVQNAGQAILILLEEDRAEASQADTSQKRSNICLSEAFLEIAAPPFLTGRCVSRTQFSEAQTNLLLTVHDRQDSLKYPDDKLSSKGAVCVWNVNEPSHPQKVLLCEGQPQCCCFSPVKANLVFAGMVDGSVVVWDLREPNSLHKQHIEGNESWFLRYPTYNTAGVLHYENHQSAVSSIVPIFVPGSADDVDSDVGATSFQLATVEENATLHLWVVAEIAHPDPAGSESDLGLAPGGKIKLIKSSAIVLESPMRDSRLRTTMKAFEMKLLPADPSHFFVGTDTGHVIHGVRHGGKAPPKAYKPDIDAPFEVTSIDFSPFTEPVFLAGCADGSIRLYHVNNAAPMIVWESTTGGRPVLAVRWCQSRPSVFFVVDAASRLYIWDLLMSDATPMKEEIISKDRLTSFCLSNDYAATGAGIAGRKPAMAVSFDTGRVEVHTVSQQFSALMPEEVDQFAMFLGNSN